MRKRSWLRRRRGDDSGVAMVEFALVLPLLAMIVFGIVDLSRAYQLQNRLRNAAREGAAFAQFYPEKWDDTCIAGDSGLADSILEKATNEDIDLGTVDGFAVQAVKISGGVETPYADCSQTFAEGDRVRVEVSAEYQIATPMISTITGHASYTLEGTSEVQVQK